MKSVMVMAVDLYDGQQTDTACSDLRQKLSLHRLSSLSSTHSYKCTHMTTKQTCPSDPSSGSLLVKI